MAKLVKSIRLMVSLSIIKQLRSLSDENIVMPWSENLYYQYFSGGVSFTPCELFGDTELVAFRKHIDAKSMELLLSAAAFIFKRVIKAI